MTGKIMLVACSIAGATAVAGQGCSAGEGPRGLDDAGAGEDASAWAPEIAEPEPPAPPAPPELPRMTPCPEGWREKVDPDDPALVTCDPWPEGGRQECAEDEAHFPGRPGCERIGPPCPEGEWPVEIPEDARVLYVRAGEREGGGGTREQPFGWIADAVAAANDGDVIALSKGLFDEEVWIDRAVTLLGACVLETRIAPSVPGAEPATLTLRAAAVVRDLQVGGAEVGVDVSRTDGTAELHSVLVREATQFGLVASFRGTLAATDLVVRETASDEGAFGYGLDASGGAEVSFERAVLERNRGVGARVAEGGTALTGTDVVLSDTGAWESGGAFGHGLEVSGGAEVTLERVVLERNRGVGALVAGGGTALNATDVVVSDTQVQESDRTLGYGLEVRGGALVTLERALFQRNRTAGLFVHEEGTVLGATDLVVSDTSAREADRQGGLGLEAIQGARVTLERAVLQRDRGVGVQVGGEGTVLAASDLVVSGTQAQESDGDAGYGLDVSGAAQVTLERALLERNRSIGVLLGDEGTTLAAMDMVVSDTQPRESDGFFGYGLEATRGAHVVLDRVALERNRGAGAAATEDGTVVAATDLVVSDTQAQESDGALGVGLAANGGAHVTLERAVFRGNRTGGVAAMHEGTVLTALHLAVLDTQARESDGRHGVGLAVIGGPTVELSRARMLDNRGYGVRVYGTGSTVTAVDIVVERTVEQECGVDVCDNATAGFGLAAESGAILDVRRFRSSDNALVGVLVASESDLDLHDGVVSGNRIGANIQIDDYDLGRLQDDVIYVDNDVNSDTSRIALPEPPGALDFAPGSS
ncbi:MAG: right-handed parallel beta-helix repeat-containing protein [Deltaproteobacteria bacterium]|nr:right-handed parallel beta-helix repeat-containing protein [Deltaproteobacteria bacterium]